MDAEWTRGTNGHKLDHGTGGHKMDIAECLTMTGFREQANWDFNY